MKPPALLTKTKVYLEKDKLGSTQNATPLKNSKPKIAGANKFASEGAFGILGTALQPSSRGPDMYKVVKVLEVPDLV